MIFGIGTDITEVRRFEKWVKGGEMITRFFNDEELFAGITGEHLNAACQHYAVRFAAKEAFSKALGTGIFGFDLKDVWIVKNQNGRPYFKFGASAQKALESACGCADPVVHVSLSHEKEYALACVIIEIRDKK
jgi:holo-[acyl-carrier protein] synthase